MDCIVTLTLNPTVDETTHIDELIPNTKLRCSPAVRQPGGGGINVARVAWRMGQPVRALWTRGGPHGQELQRLLEEEGVAHEPLPIQQTTRRNLSIQVGPADELYRLVYPGPSLTREEGAAVLERVDRIRAAAFFVASGSLPPDTDRGFYGEVLRRVPRSVPTVVDTSGRSLAAVVRAGATLIKPNQRELAQLVGRDLQGVEAVREAAREVVTGSAVEVVVVSLGGEGAVVASQQGVEHVAAPQVTPRSEVGAGDSAVAGIVVGLARGLPLREAVALGMACGAAAVSTPGTQLAPIETIRSLYGALPEP